MRFSVATIRGWQLIKGSIYYSKQFAGYIAIHKQGTSNPFVCFLQSPFTPQKAITKHMNIDPKAEDLPIRLKND